jgi:hypothetical protein
MHLLWYGTSSSCVRLPVLAHALEELLERQLALRLRDHVAELGAVLGQVGAPDVAQRQLAQHPVDVEALAQLAPVALAQRLAVQVGDNDVVLEQLLDARLHEAERVVLAHAARHLLERLEHRLELLAHLARLDRRPLLLAHQVERAPHVAERVPHAAQRLELLAHRLEPLARVGGRRAELERLARRRQPLVLAVQRLERALGRRQRQQRVLRRRRRIVGDVARPLGDERAHFGVERRRVVAHALLQHRNVRLDRRLLAAQQLAERAPLALDHRKVEPVGGERVARAPQQLLAGVEALDARRPLRHLALGALQRDNERDGGRRRRRVERQRLERLARRRQLLVRAAHHAAEPRAKRAQRVAVPVVVLGVDLLLHLRVVDHNRTKLASRRRVVKRGARAS